MENENLQVTHDKNNQSQYSIAYMVTAEYCIYGSNTWFYSPMITFIDFVEVTSEVQLTIILCAKYFHMCLFSFDPLFSFFPFCQEVQIVKVHLELANQFSVSHCPYFMTSFYIKSYKRVSKLNFLDSSSDEEEENRRTSVQTKQVVDI